jgi:hypothetical protein
MRYPKNWQRLRLVDVTSPCDSIFKPWFLFEAKCIFEHQFTVVSESFVHQPIYDWINDIINGERPCYYRQHSRYYRSRRKHEDCYPPCRQSIAVQNWHYQFQCGPSDNKTLQLVRMVRLGVLMTCLWSWLIDIKSVKSLSYDLCVLWVMGTTTSHFKSLKHKINHDICQKSIFWLGTDTNMWKG